MLIENLRELFRRDLNKLKTEISLFKQEEKIWQVGQDITNSAGNLTLHLIGNLNTYIGAELGKTGYIRDRDAEFALKNIPRNVLLEKLDATIAVVDRSLQEIKPEDLENDYSLMVFERKMTVGYFLLHLAMHLAYHLGQVNYQRRFFDN